MLDSPFMDEVHRATYDFKSAPDVGKLPAVQQVLGRYRQQLRQAERMVLDDDAVRMICQMSHIQNRFDLWSILARLPYDSLWIELDLHVKVKEWERMGTLRSPFVPADVSKACGYLLQREPDSQSRWVATEWVAVGQSRKDKRLTPALGEYPIPQPVSFVFDPEGSAIKPVAGSTLWNLPTLSRLDKAMRLPVHMRIEAENDPAKDELWEVDPEFGYSGAFEAGDAETPVKIADWARYKVGAVIEPVWYHSQNPRLMQSVYNDITERTGALRWLIAALAVINDVPNTRLIKNARPGRMQARAHLVPYFQHHVVTLKIPRGARAFLAVKRALDKSAVVAHRAWHRVRGHWRVIEYGKRLPFICRHEPSESHDGVATCLRCERIIRWIAVQYRGDPALGIIDHEYRVTA